MYYYNNNY